MDVEQSVKEIEVTAKQIVDGISRNNNPPGGNNDKVDKAGKPSHYMSLSSSYPGREVVGDDETAPQEVPDNTNVKTGEGAGVVEQVVEPEYELTEHEKKSRILLNALTKWMRESIPESSDKNIKVETLKENFHWVFGVESYIRSLSSSSQKALISKIMAQFVNWHKQLFHFKEKRKDDDVEFNRVLAHWEMNKGIIAITKLNLYTNFPNFATLGVDSFQDGRTPVIYCSDETLGRHVATQIGLSYKFVQAINTEDGEWVANLEQSILSNKETKIPIVLILDVEGRNLHDGCRLAEAYNIWVHLYGSNLLPYFMCRKENSQIGSSFTIDINKWINTPVLPYTTLYKISGKSDSELVEQCELTSAINDLVVFTPWFILNIVGHDEIRSIVNETVRLGNFLYNMVQRYECLKIVPTWSELSDGSKIITTLTFQYQPPGFSRTINPDVDDDKVARPTAAYVDTLNSWLYHIMDRDLKDFIPVEFVCAESGGWNIFIDVIRCSLHEPEDEGVVKVVNSLFDHHLSVLQSTVTQKQTFSRLVEEAEELVWVEHESQWAGLGAVRYIPAFHRKSAEHEASLSATETTEKDEKPQVQDSKSNSASSAAMKENIDHLNAQIVDKLKAIDTAFSLGENSTGEWCVQFGMVTMETDVQELVRLVISTGQEIEESSEFFNRMSELVKKGIEKATEELKRESEEALWEEGILRRVPVVGTFVNWLSPPTKETGIRGRALNLTQGRVESTENIYKYHMQIESHGFGTGNNK